MTGTATFDANAMLQAIDWQLTSLGPRPRWPRALETLLALMLRSARPQYLVWGPDRRFFYNEAFLPVMGLKHPDGFGQPMAQVWPEVWDEIQPLVSATIDDGQSHYFEDRPFVLRRYGVDELTYFSFSYTPVEGDDGGVAGLMCVLTERTRQVHDERHRREELRRMQGLFQQAPGFMCVTHGADHVIELANDAYERLVGKRRHDLLGKRLADAVPEAAAQGFVALLDHAYETGEPFVGREMRVSLTRRAGALPEDRVVDFVYQPICDADGKTSGAFIQGVDVTDRVRAEASLRSSEQALRDANERKDRFLAVLGHELRNPLAPIHSAAQVLGMLTGGDARVRQCVDVIERQVRHMTSLVEDLVDVARITNDLVTLRRSVLDVRCLVASAVEQLRPRIDERRHEVTVRLPEEAPRVDGDETRLIQVVSNVLSNAIRYTPPGGAIAVTVTAKARRVYIEVADNGDGIAADLLPNLFVPFVQAERSPDRTRGGLGVGLPLAQRLLEAHGGRIEARSAGPGQGSRFTIELPRCA